MIDHQFRARKISHVKVENLILAKIEGQRGTRAMRGFQELAARNRWSDCGLG